jgi:hypothetical protein
VRPRLHRFLWPAGPYPTRLKNIAGRASSPSVAAGQAGLSPGRQAEACPTWDKLQLVQAREACPRRRATITPSRGALWARLSTGADDPQVALMPRLRRLVSDIIGILHDALH